MSAYGPKWTSALFLSACSPNSIVFADRPVRAAGHALTAHLLEEWSVGSESFAKDPPNATVSVLNSDGSTVMIPSSFLKRQSLKATV